MVHGFCSSLCLKSSHLSILSRGTVTLMHSSTLWPEHGSRLYHGVTFFSRGLSGQGIQGIPGDISPLLKASYLVPEGPGTFSRTRSHQLQTETHRATESSFTDSPAEHKYGHMGFRYQLLPAFPLILHQSGTFFLVILFYNRTALFWTKEGRF